uniref:Uncharacterized protein n=1 Tax=viral metagenome TaxID=1070528 RepID=A0A6C0JVV6_9ZZZZ
MQENILIRGNHVLVLLDDENQNDQIEYLKTNFWGDVRNDNLSSYKYIYLAGDVSKYNKNDTDATVFVILELSNNYTDTPFTVVTLGEVPLNMHGIGVYFRKFFCIDSIFNQVKQSHTFQNLTESNKTGNALRKGIYLTEVTPDHQFHLLRCSTNLTGPTENFRPVDTLIVDKVNSIVDMFFESQVTLNHVLAQIYENGPVKKAAIKSHSDKTKDMPRNGIMAFCTFYDGVGKGISDGFDLSYKGTSVLTRLHWKNKTTGETFDVPLYPNSLYMVPLSTNRLWIHEIRASILPPEYLPTRLGYVIRCSNTKAVWRDGQTFIGQTNEIPSVPLVPMTEEIIQQVRNLYYLENTTTDIITYPFINSSMNSGDYKCPIV